MSDGTTHKKIDDDNCVVYCKINRRAITKVLLFLYRGLTEKEH
jgi:hypothetical protein